MEEEIISNEEILTYLQDVATETLEVFNAQYGEDATFNEDIEEYILAFAIISIYGYARLKNDKTIPEYIKSSILEGFDKSYEGIKATTRKELEQLKKRLGRDPLATEINAFRDKRRAEIKDGLFGGSYNQVEALLAIEQGYRFVGAVNTPPNVRPTHKVNDRRYWPIGSYSPWNDYNCKCRYVYFKTAIEAQEAGYIRL